MKPTFAQPRPGAGLPSSSSSSTAAGASHTAAPSTSSSSVKYELLSFRSAQPPQPIRFEFGPAKETFTVDLPTDPNDGTTRQQSWREWKRQALEHPVVRKHFKTSAVLTAADFALRLPGAPGEWIGPESVKDDQEADNKLLLRLGGATSTTSSVLLLYAPQIHICTFDGIKFAASSFGHWLSASDTKTWERLRKLEGASATGCPNDWLLKEQHQSDFARLLYRIALFMKEDLGLGPEGYIISIPFGQFIYADGDGIARDEVRARVQVTDARIFWTLLLKFEEKLNDDEGDDRIKRLDYFVHQRQAWIDARSLDYRRWAAQEASSVRAALENLTPPAHAPAQFKLPKNCSWDEYGRMQLCLKMLSPICDMVGQMGAISVKLKNVVSAVQMAAQLTGTSAANLPVSINVSARNDQCLVLLPADRYMSVLTRANADPKAWGLALLEALRDAPDRLYSGLLNETSGLYQCSRDDLGKLDEALKSLAPRPLGYKGIAKIVDTSVLPVTTDIIRSLESKNNTDKRLFLERAQEAKGAVGLGGVGSTVVAPTENRPAPQPTIWDKKRAAAAPPPPPQPVREAPIPIPANPDREDLSLKNEDFARFESLSLKPAPVPVVESAFPSRAPPPMAVSQVKAVLQRPTSQPQERPPPPTVFAQPPPQDEQRRGPPRVLDIAGDQQQQTRRGPPTVLKPQTGSEKPPPPQVKQAPPTVIPPPKKKEANGANPAQEAPTAEGQQQGVSRQQNRRPPYPPRQQQPQGQENSQEWRNNKPPVQQQQQERVQPAQQPQETFSKAKDLQNMDREDRGYDTTPSTVSGRGRGGNRSFRGRGGGRGGRGGYNNTRGGTRSTDQEATTDRD